MAEGEEDRGVKRAGKKTAEGKEAELQRIRESGVLLVTYLNDGDIPESPSEPFLEELVSSQQTVPPKVIPMPQELRMQTVKLPHRKRNELLILQGGAVAVPNPPTAMANPEVTAILNSLLAGSGQPTYQAPAPLQTPDLASILQSLGGQPSLPPPPVTSQQPSIPANLDLSALLSQLQPQQPAPQRWTSPPPSARTRRDERHREPERERPAKKRDVGSRIKASRQDDIRESVRNSTADQNMYRALCQFYVSIPRKWKC